MGRKNRRTPPPKPRPTVREPAPEEHPDGRWHVRQISGAAATKTYRCPGCNQAIAPGIPHVVAWSADQYNGEDFRRHWHTPCWNFRSRRRPS